MKIKMIHEIDERATEWYMIYVDGHAKSCFRIDSDADKDRAWAAYDFLKENKGSKVVTLKEEEV